MELGHLDRKGPSSNGGQTRCGKSKHPINLVPGDSRKPLQELIYGRACIQILEESRNRNAGTKKHPSPTDLGRVFLDGVAFGPVHPITILENRPGSRRSPMSDDGLPGLPSEARRPALRKGRPLGSTATASTQRPFGSRRSLRALFAWRKVAEREGLQPLFASRSFIAFYRYTKFAVEA